MREGPKFFVKPRGKEAREKRRRFKEAESLFGTAAHVDEAGIIYIEQWPEKRRGTISPEDFTTLSKRKRPDSVLMRKGLKTKSVRSKEIHHYKTIESAMRSVDYILKGQENELLQARVVRERTRYLINFFQEHELSRISEEQRRALQEETIAMLSEVGLDPDAVRLEVKRLMILWTAKGSSGQDSLGRDNELMTFQRLRAAEKRARKRELVVRGNIVLKYSPIGGAFALARTTAREKVFEVGDEVDRRLVPNVYLANPDAPIWRDINHTIRKIDILSDLLEDVLVEPYRQIAILGEGYLRQTKLLLQEKTPQALHQLHDRGFVQGVRQVMSLDPEVGLFGKTLGENAEVYPENSS